MDNDFLGNGQRFPSSENHAVPNYISDKGEIRAYPWTLMESRWEGKDIIRSIGFIWNGGKFERVEQAL